MSSLCHITKSFHYRGGMNQELQWHTVSTLERVGVLLLLLLACYSSHMLTHPPIMKHDYSFNWDFFSLQVECLSFVGLISPYISFCVVKVRTIIPKPLMCSFHTNIHNIHTWKETAPLSLQGTDASVSPSPEIQLGKGSTMSSLS